VRSRTGGILARSSAARATAPGPEVEAFLAGYDPEVRAIALALRRLVLSVVPQAIEQVDPPGRLIGYGLARTYRDMICVIMPLKAGVNLGFPRGVDLADPVGLLVGTGKRARHVRVATLDEAAAPALRALLEASAAQLSRA